MDGERFRGWNLQFYLSRPRGFVYLYSCSRGWTSGLDEKCLNYAAIFGDSWNRMLGFVFGRGVNLFLNKRKVE